MIVLKRKRYRLLLLLVVLFVLMLIFPSWTPDIKGDRGEALPNSVSLLERVELGGIEQSVLIRGKYNHNPIVLFLHGGPGYPQIAYARKYQEKLEQDFVVVNWDQRGSGKSYHWNMTDDDLQIEKLVEDTRELTAYLQRKFNQPRIFIVGHSWGSLLATLTVQKYPELYYAYIGVGQVANSPLGEQVSYRFALEEANRQNDEQAIEELTSIGPPPYQNPRIDTTLERK